MANKKTTIEDLAKVMQGGFGGVDKKFDEMGRMVQKGFEDVGRQFSGINERFDRVEKLILVDHRQRIEKLETQVKELRELFAVK